MFESVDVFECECYLNVSVSEAKKAGNEEMGKGGVGGSK